MKALTLAAGTLAAAALLVLALMQPRFDASAIGNARVGTIDGKECINCQTAPAFNCNRCETFPSPWTDPDSGIQYNSLKCDKDLPLKCCAGSSGTCNDFVAICASATEAFTDKNCTQGHVTFAIQCTKSSCNTL